MHILPDLREIENEFSVEAGVVVVCHYTIFNRQQL